MSEVVGQCTIQLRLVAFDQQFNSGDFHFAIQSEIKLFKYEKEEASWEAGKWLPEAFRQLFNLEVSGVSIPNTREIAITFEGGLAMHLYDNSEQYETMQIQMKGDSTTCII